MSYTNQAQSMKIPATERLLLFEQKLWMNGATKRGQSFHNVAFYSVQVAALDE